MSISRFNSEDESNFHIKLANLKSEFSYSTYGVDNIFNECKFKNAMHEFKKIATVTTPFEKLVKN